MSKPVGVHCVQRAHPRWENRVKVANIYSFDRRLREAIVQKKAWELFEFAVRLVFTRNSWLGEEKGSFGLPGFLQYPTVLL